MGKAMPRSATRMAWGVVVLGVMCALVALACLSFHVSGGPGALLSRRGSGAGPAAVVAGVGRTRGQGTVATLLRDQAFDGNFDGAFVTELVKGIRRDVNHVERHSARAFKSAGNARGWLPSMRQVLQMRKKRAAESQLEDEQFKRVLGAKAVNCEGKSQWKCDLDLDMQSMKHMLKAEPRARQEQLLQLSRFQASATDLQRRMGGASAKAGSPSLKMLEQQEADLKKQNSLERKINSLLKNNAMLAQQNAMLSKNSANTKGLEAQQAEALLAKTKASQQRSSTTVMTLKRRELEDTNVARLTKASLVASKLDVHGNPEGMPEHVPATVTASVPGPPDFNGATGIVARLPDIGYAPSVLDANGVEKRGSFTLRKANPYGGIMLRVYGRINHPLKCTLKGYRKLGGMFMGQTVYTGYKKVWTGKTTFSTGIIPPGSSDSFDLITCRDMHTGEVQHFRTFPTPPPSFGIDPGDPEFQDEYMSHASTPDHP